MPTSRGSSPWGGASARDARGDSAIPPGMYRSRSGSTASRRSRGDCSPRGSVQRRALRRAAARRAEPVTRSGSTSSASGRSSGGRRRRPRVRARGAGGDRSEIASGEEPSSVLLRFWCRGEAELKAIGSGISGQSAHREGWHPAGLRVAELSTVPLPDDLRSEGVQYQAAVALCELARGERLESPGQTSQVGPRGSRRRARRPRSGIRRTPWRG